MTVDPRKKTNPAYELACAEIGTLEWSRGHNPKIIAYFRDAAHSWVKDDETAWCAAFVNAMLERTGVPGTKKLNARSFLDWGDPVALDEARKGDICVLSRGNPKGWQGHVAFLEEDKGNTLLLLGGNQSNAVNILPYKKDRLLGIRRASIWDEEKVPARDLEGSVDTAKPVPMPKKKTTNWEALAGAWERMFGKR